MIVSLKTHFGGLQLRQLQFFISHSVSFFIQLFQVLDFVGHSVVSILVTSLIDGHIVMSRSIDMLSLIARVSAVWREVVSVTLHHSVI